jgi:hypothetical protein
LCPTISNPLDILYLCEKQTGFSQWSPGCSQSAWMMMCSNKTFYKLIMLCQDTS